MTIKIRQSTRKFQARKKQNAVKRVLIASNLSHRKRTRYFLDSLDYIVGNRYAAQAAADTMMRSPSMSKDLYKVVPVSVLSASRYNVNDLTSVITWWGVTGPSPGDMDGDNDVDIDDLTKVIMNWDTTPPTPPTLTPCGTINLGPGDHTIRNMDIMWSDGWGKAVNGEGSGIGRVVIENCRIRSKNYGLYFAGCTSLSMSDFTVESGLIDMTGPDPYCIRGVIPSLMLARGLFHNNGEKGVYRVYNCGSAQVEDVEFRGGRVMLGGGGGDEVLNQLKYIGHHERCLYNAQNAQVYNKTDLVDVAGTWNCGVTVWNQGGKLTLKQSVKQPVWTGGGTVIVQ